MRISFFEKLLTVKILTLDFKSLGVMNRYHNTNPFENHLGFSKNATSCNVVMFFLYRSGAVLPRFNRSGRFFKLIKYLIRSYCSHKWLLKCPTTSVFRILATFVFRIFRGEIQWNWVLYFCFSILLISIANLWTPVICWVRKRAFTITFFT